MPLLRVPPFDRNRKSICAEPRFLWKDWMRQDEPWVQGKAEFTSRKPHLRSRRDLFEVRDGKSWYCVAVVEPAFRRDFAANIKIHQITGALQIVRPFEIKSGFHLLRLKAECCSRNRQL
jgi:hypothetical protein